MKTCMPSGKVMLLPVTQRVRMAMQADSFIQTVKFREYKVALRHVLDCYAVALVLAYAASAIHHQVRTSLDICCIFCTL
eukprot:1567722-Rhodomonas_salina.5